MADMNAESMNKSLAVQGGNLRQHLGQDVAPLSTPTDCELSKKQLLVLIRLFEGLLHNTCSPDVRQLSVIWAAQSLKGIIHKDEVLEIAKKLMAIRRKNPMDILF